MASKKTPETSKTPASEKEYQAMLRKGQLIQSKLEELYPGTQRNATTMTHENPFTLLVSTLLSAQTLGTMVRKVTPRLFAEASSPADMVALGAARIQPIIAPIGLSKVKAKYIVQMSQMLVDDYDGRVPETLDQLERLPGIGHKTASIVMLFGFNKPAFPVDTHIHRMACRWGCGNPKSVLKTEDSMKKWFPDQSRWADLHLQLIRFGREHCVATRHDMERCPICVFAATNEAKAANLKSSKKFVAAERHENPYSVHELGTSGHVSVDDEEESRLVKEENGGVEITQSRTTKNRGRKRKASLESGNLGVDSDASSASNVVEYKDTSDNDFEPENGDLGLAKIEASSLGLRRSARIGKRSR